MTDACVAVDAIVVGPGEGALVQAGSAAGGQVGGTRYLVTDTGVKHRLPTQADAEALGYEGGQVRTVPSLLLTMLPTGPDLGSAAAGVSPEAGEETPKPVCRSGKATGSAERPSTSQGASE
ncbi:hypothetical protein G3M53_90625 [Streptomyces sp. SID7982]|nr:hypothetical protein [Streptomyces sp. SID7982]